MRHGVEQHREALALLVASDEEDGRALCLPWLHLAAPTHLDPVEENLVFTAEGGRSHGRRVLGYGEGAVQATVQPPHPGIHDVVGEASTGGVERADHGGCGKEERCRGRTGRQRFVQVDDIEFLVAQRPDRAQGA